MIYAARSKFSGGIAVDLDKLSVSQILFESNGVIRHVTSVFKTSLEMFGVSSISISPLYIYVY